MMRADVGDGDAGPCRWPWATACAVAALAAAGCVSSASSPPLDPKYQPPGPGIVFSYPRDGQYDVPVGARILLTFSDPVPTPVDTACGRSGGQVTGSLCVEGPDGFVPGTVTVDGATVAFVPTGGLAEGAAYEVWARPSLLPIANNLAGEAPLFTFHARSTRIRPDEAATVLTVNGAALNADGTSPLPFLDDAPLRLVFSEPLDAATVDAASVRLVHAADSAAVEGIALAQGIHLTFQPAGPLVAGDAYRLEIAGAVRDLGGEPIAPATVRFTPSPISEPGHSLYTLGLNVAPPWVDGAAHPRSRVAAMPVNANVYAAQLVGANTQGVLAGGLDALVGDPQAGGTLMPMVIRRGQRIDLTSTVIREGGAIEMGVETGTLHFTMLTDAFGYQLRNPYRAASQIPDDAQAPAWVDFTMDAVLSGEDAHGNTVATQTVMGVRTLGIATLEGTEIAMDQAGAIDLDLFGLETTPVDLALRVQTGTRTPGPALGTPVLASSYPADGARDVPPGEPVELNFTGPLDPARVRSGTQVTLTTGGTAVAASTRLVGTTLVVAPSSRLDEGASYTLDWAGLRSLGGANVADGRLSFSTANTSAAAAVAPILTVLVPGAPCALVGATATSPGHCAGGKDTDDGYQPFTLPANRDVHMYFDQSIDPATLTVGAACGQGSVRIERVDADGRCAGVVPGTLVTRDRAARFAPAAPWQAGAAYRLTLVAGPDATCGPSEICGRNGKPLNTHPLAGVAAVAGGPDVVVDFTGAPATQDAYQFQESDPFVDQNGTGYVDASERPNDENVSVFEVAGVGGAVTAASLSGADCRPDRVGQQTCSYLHSTTPESIGGVLPNCPIDAQGQPSTAPNPCVQVRVYPHLITGTSTSMSSTTTVLIFPIPLQDQPNGKTITRFREVGGPAYGYIMNEPGVAEAQFVIVMDAYFDAPDLTLPFGATHDLHSKPIHTILKGPITFRPDGRLQTELRSLTNTTLTVTIGSLAGSGHIDLRIPAGQMRINIVGPPIR
jgi:hypothetical protein